VEVLVIAFQEIHQQSEEGQTILRVVVTQQLVEDVKTLFAVFHLLVVVVKTLLVVVGLLVVDDLMLDVVFIHQLVVVKVILLVDIVQLLVEVH
jgi:hypothetical protein